LSMRRPDRRRLGRLIQANLEHLCQENKQGDRSTGWGATRRKGCIFRVRRQRDDIHRAPEAIQA
jgi:hypothetical protein